MIVRIIILRIGFKSPALRKHIDTNFNIQIGNNNTSFVKKDVVFNKSSKHSCA